MFTRGIQRISTKLILSFFFLVILALAISGAVFFISYSITLQQSEYEALKLVAQELSLFADKYFKTNTTIHIGSTLYNYLEELSNYEDINITLYNNSKEILYTFVPPDLNTSLGNQFSVNRIPHFGNRQINKMARELNRLPILNFRNKENEKEDFLEDGIQEKELFLPFVLPRQSSININIQDQSGENIAFQIFRLQSVSHNFLNAAWRGFSISVIIACLASIIAGIILGKRITRPILNLKQTALAMAEGQYNLRAEVNSHDETADLAESFNVLGNSLEQRIQELRNERDSLRNFLADVSHELRTPLTTMLTSSEILGEQLDLSNEELQNLYNHNHNSLLHMKKLVEHLLSLSRLQGGIQQLNIEACSLTSIIQETLELLLDLKEAKKIKWSIPDKLPSVLVDKLSFLQVFRNCFENSINAGATIIQIRVKQNQEECTISIIDNGMGIAEEALRQITKRFYRGTKSKGTGLGLAIVESTIHAHGGSMQIISPACQTNNSKTIASSSSKGCEVQFHFSKKFLSE